jgi:CRP-like cAMP-binding protein
MSLDQEVDLIRRFPIFSKLPAAKQKLLAFTSERLNFDIGHVLFRAGDRGEACYIVIDGSIAISVPTPNGPLVVNTLGRNEIIGEIAVFGDVPRTATATTLSRVEALRISKDQFLSVVRENPEVAVELIKILAVRLANTTAQFSKARGGD